MHHVGRESLATTLVVAIDCGKAQNRHSREWGAGVIAELVTLLTLREGVDDFCRLIAEAGPAEPTRSIRR